ncbi:MAG: hypothetical protein ACREOR_00195 [Candidatus Binatia bacterium]
MAEQSLLNLDELRVRPVKRSEEARHHELMAAHHYLGFLPKIGETLWYVATYDDECLRILLRGKQPIIICLARAMEKIRLPMDWREALKTDRLLLLSPFEKRPRCPTDVITSAASG